MQLLKTVVKLVSGVWDLLVAIVVIFGIMLALTGNLTWGCQKAWFTNTITCAANLIIPGR